LSNVKEIVSKTLSTQGTYGETAQKEPDVFPVNRGFVNMIRDTEFNPFANVRQFPGDGGCTVTIQGVFGSLLL